MSVSFGGFTLKNRLVAASSPLTESLARLRCCRAAGFGAAVLKTACPYVRTGKGYGRKVVYIGEGYYADSSFEREVMTLDEGLALYRGARELGLGEGMPLIPSVSVDASDPEPWLDACRAFQDAGARLIQLDFFYLGTLLDSPGFQIKLDGLLRGLSRGLRSAVMPKLSVRFSPEEACRLLARNGVRHICLLAPVRQIPPPEYGLHSAATSQFGGFQLPLTRRYLKAARLHGLHACVGGGITAPADAALLRAEGAELVQTASYVLKNGFGSAAGLLAALDPAGAAPAPGPAPLLAHGTWCDVEDGEECEHCGGCAVGALPAGTGGMGIC